MKYLKKFNEEIGNPQKPEVVELSYERWMKEFTIVDDYEGNGPGTIFGGDSGYIDSYDELIERLKDELSYYLPQNNFEFIRVHDENLTTFVKGLSIYFFG
jgi:hypothetical protein